MNLRSGVVTHYQPIQSKGFNVKARANAPASSNVLITANADKQLLARSYFVVFAAPQSGIPANLSNAHHYAESLKAQHPSHQTFLLIGYGDDYLYYSAGAVSTRGPNASAAAAKPNPNFPFQPHTDQLKIVVHYTAPATQGSDLPIRSAVMGATAKNYVSSTFGPGFAENRNWEWLHIVGRSLGGDHKVGNLIAGTFDANTQMIPYERRILALTQLATPTSPLTATYEVNLFPNSWAAIDLRMSYQGAGGAGQSPWIRAQTDIPFDKLQYDLWLKA